MTLRLVDDKIGIELFPLQVPSRRYFEGESLARDLAAVKRCSIDLSVRRVGIGRTALYANAPKAVAFPRLALDKFRKRVLNYRRNPLVARELLSALPQFVVSKVDRLVSHNSMSIHVLCV